MKVHQLVTVVWIVLFTVVSCRPVESEHIALATATSIPVNSSQEPSLVFFTSEQGKFQVWLPFSTDVQEFTINKTLFQRTLECPTTFYRLNSASAIIQYCDLLPQTVASLSDNEILDQSRDGILDPLHIRVQAERKELSQNLYPSLVLSGQIDMRGVGYDGTFKARMILVDRRIYLIVMNVDQENWCNCLHQVNQVVDSLYIEPSLSIPFEPTP